jgi:sulfur carrier protein ThiS
VKVSVHTTGYLLGRDQYRKNLELEIAEGSTIRDLLSELKIAELAKIAVFIDRERQKDLDRVLKADSTVEIFTLVGGG